MILQISVMIGVDVHYIIYSLMIKLFCAFLNYAVKIRIDLLIFTWSMFTLLTIKILLLQEAKQKPFQFYKSWYLWMASNLLCFERNITLESNTLIRINILYCSLSNLDFLMVTPLHWREKLSLIFIVRLSLLKQFMWCRENHQRINAYIIGVPKILHLVAPNDSHFSLSFWINCWSIVL